MNNNITEEVNYTADTTMKTTLSLGRAFESLSSEIPNILSLSPISSREETKTYSMIGQILRMLLNTVGHIFNSKGTASHARLCQWETHYSVNTLLYAKDSA